MQKQWFINVPIETGQLQNLDTRKFGCPITNKENKNNERVQVEILKTFRQLKTRVLEDQYKHRS